jgi:hypothetical protein
MIAARKQGLKRLKVKAEESTALDAVTRQLVKTQQT